MESFKENVGKVLSVLNLNYSDLFDELIEYIEFPKENIKTIYGQRKTQKTWTSILVLLVKCLTERFRVYIVSHSRMKLKNLENLTQSFVTKINEKNLFLDCFNQKEIHKNGSFLFGNGSKMIFKSHRIFSYDKLYGFGLNFTVYNFVLYDDIDPTVFYREELLLKFMNLYLDKRLLKMHSKTDKYDFELMNLMMYTTQLSAELEFENKTYLDKDVNHMFVITPFQSFNSLNKKELKDELIKKIKEYDRFNNCDSFNCENSILNLIKETNF